MKRIYKDNHAKETILSHVSPKDAIELYTMQRSSKGRYICPFHDDHDPSLSVKGAYWRCWSCNEHGNVIDFTIRYFGIGYAEALRKLNDDFSLSIEFEGAPVRDPYGRIWAKTEKEVRERRKKDYEELSQELKCGINVLTATHRVLLNHNAPDHMLDECVNDIERLQSIENTFGLNQQIDFPKWYEECKKWSEDEARAFTDSIKNAHYEHKDFVTKYVNERKDLTPSEAEELAIIYNELLSP